jgi:hypothetical protein
VKLVRLTYASRFARGVGPAQVEDIMRASRRRNPKAGITGALCYAPGLFLQCLEGPRDAVNALYRRIAADPRHRDLALLEFSEIGRRAFARWSMAYVRADRLPPRVQGRIGGARRFDPFAMDAREALAFIAALARERELLEESAAADAAV